jgi:hypothetical protein
MASGNIVTLPGGPYQYELPPMPSDEKEILFYDLPKGEQYWRIPPRKKLKGLSQYEKTEYIMQQNMWWADGLWMFVNGEPIYITGMHFDHLVNMTFDFGKARYYDHQRYDFYFRDLVRKAANCYGMCWLKPRRYGMTAEEMTNSTYVLMEGFNHKVGLQSNTAPKAMSTLMQPIIDSYLKRPKYTRPPFYSVNGKRPRTRLELTDPLIGDDEDFEYGEGSEYLGGMIEAYATTPGAQDGLKKFYMVMDEVWKWIEASPQETLDINKKCVENLGLMGRISMLSTMGDSDDYGMAIKEGIAILDKSNPLILTQNGRTLSGLWEYFVSAIYSHALPNFYDIFGTVDAGRAEEFIYNERNNLDPSTKAYVFEVRRMPLNKAEGMLVTTGKVIWDKIRLSIRLTQLRQLPLHKKPWVRGNLVEDQYGHVHFEPNEKGKWKVAVHPYFSAENNIDTRNRFKKVGADFEPPRNREFGIGYDPVRFAETSSNSVSRACILVKKKFDYFGSGVANRYAAIYLERPEDPDDATAEAVKACKYWGAKCMYERNVEGVKKVFVANKMLPFLSKSKKDGLYGMWVGNNKKVMSNGVDMIQASEMKKPEPGEEDLLMYHPFEETLEDRSSFDPTNTTPYDTTMADIQLQHELEQIEFTNVVDEEDTNRGIKSVLYPKRQISKLP